MTCSLIQFGQGAAPLNPLGLNPKFYFRSDLGITTSGSSVHEWADQSGNGFNLTNALGSPVYPTYSASGGVNGLPKLTFGSSGGSACCLYNASFSNPTHPLEYIIVAEASSSSPSASGVLIDCGIDNDYCYQSANSLNIYATNGNPIGALAVTASAPFIVDAYFSASPADFIALNGGSPSSGTSAGSTAQAGSYLCVGNLVGSLANAWVGDIYEVFGIDASLSSSNRAAYIAWLMSRYAIG
jgi:hypothetical protein